MDTELTLQEQIYRVGLSACLEIGSRRMRSLLQHLGSAEAVWSASLQTLQTHAGLSPRTAEKVHSHCRQTDPHTLYEKTLEAGYQLCFFESSDYPTWLKTIHDPPFLLYWQGNPETWKSLNPALAIVGTRQATSAGLELTRNFARELAMAGVTIVSGLATGIDTAAHLGALDADGKTVAVLGMGLAQITPAEKRRLAHTIQQNGLVISEFSPAFKATRWSFPLRNRIVSGLSQGLLVVEAAPKSGALITADLAIEQGREVMAVPGPVMAPQSAGPHALIQQGAALVTSVPEICQVMGWEVSLPVLSEAQPEDKGLTNSENEVYLVLSEMPQTIESLTQKIEWPVSKLLTVLTQLEIKGWVQEWPGSRFSRSGQVAHQNP
ncbi:DNA-protecting protein DprA [bacterium (Candidatus Blackallbacteria) CG17_big_fil_post_rev_8_21_14_2_50_48_46]|uniref:DNA-protecting protein DprA n=1 Tax=bacterium (Candidatus Blackallbacteria) CG17_big_fil_post_rev_8_21_14_2_50_48_46 TaxID=2014261 RepID=A0A2M7G948_9BACT|nr:MAG: DNA-protecting protein DprA [bacterium (Candidatus Blackallbacteria) CG18_big_fil_WC_8_21_14_2_50_49_26]PIW18646.1 MAG: DNA-protecting protein DprA [bacterium (Candidatus Blackallbacteria) CG17_big_fil_post_rev_8_21_14_2_50_48_46]PIW46368.1 MAG: DNA-protecting protein DprA [bacterium (Candidatus Blackallbacteria) CG13_big_fil_rev_8_21_14_2_50_49_14]